MIGGLSQGCKNGNRDDGSASTPITFDTSSRGAVMIIVGILLFDAILLTGMLRLAYDEVPVRQSWRDPAAALVVVLVVNAAILSVWGLSFLGGEGGYWWLGLAMLVSLGVNAGVVRMILRLPLRRMIAVIAAFQVFKVGYVAGIVFWLTPLA